LRRFERRCRAGIGSEIRDEPGQGLGPAGITDHDIVAARDGKSRDLASDPSGTDKTDGCHDSYILPYITCAGDLLIARKVGIATGALSILILLDSGGEWTS
jgi:hypothetical protein